MQVQRVIVLLSGVSACCALLLTSQPASAAEGGHGVYLLGLRSTAVGIAPPPGIYFVNNAYYYSGSASANLTFPAVGGQVVSGVKAKVPLNLASVLWSTPVQVLGGNLAFSALLPIGGPIVDVGGTVTSPFLGSGISAARHGSIFSYGDPALTSSIGWHAGHFHWMFGVTGFVPVGDYQQGALANVANHRWAADVSGAATWLDPNIGLDLSAALGVTFNKENSATNYKTGNEFHFEWAATQNLSKQFSVGIVGYYYRQLTGDSGSGAVLGAFKGEVTALGGTVGYNFMAGNVPISTRVRVYREFDVKNRLEGTAGFFTVAIPLHMHGAPAPASGAIVAKN
jgi:hypothetical protein